MKNVHLHANGRFNWLITEHQSVNPSREPIYIEIYIEIPSGKYKRFTFVHPVTSNTLKVRACSHEPGTVNYPGASVTSRSHDDLLSRGNVAFGQLHCPGASSSSSGHHQFI